MFGHQDEPTQQNTNDTPASTNSWDNQTPVSAPPSEPSATPVDQPIIDGDHLLETQAADGFTGAAPSDDQPADAPQDTPQDQPQDQPASVPSDLAELKQEALQQLSPLLNHLDQSPEEKFRTTMMMIQASDNRDLLQTAYDAANQIPDEKAKAQALLDVINEINYFSQNKPQ